MNLRLLAVGKNKLTVVIKGALGLEEDGGRVI